MRPWRYTVIKGKHREAFADLVVEAMGRQEPDAPEAKKTKRHHRFANMPMIIALGMHLQPEEDPGDRAGNGCGGRSDERPERAACCRIRRHVGDGAVL